MDGVGGRGEATVLAGLRSRTGRGAKCTVEQLLVSEPVPEFTFESPDGNQILRGARVLVR